MSASGGHLRTGGSNQKEAQEQPPLVLIRWIKAGNLPVGNSVGGLPPRPGIVQRLVQGPMGSEARKQICPSTPFPPMSRGPHCVGKGQAACTCALLCVHLSRSCLRSNPSKDVMPLRLIANNPDKTSTGMFCLAPRPGLAPGGPVGTRITALHIQGDCVAWPML